MGARYTQQGLFEGPSRPMDVQHLETHGTMLVEFDPESGSGAFALVEARQAGKSPRVGLGFSFKTSVLWQRAQSSSSCRDSLSRQTLGVASEALALARPFCIGCCGVGSGCYGVGCAVGGGCCGVGCSCYGVGCA